MDEKVNCRHGNYLKAKSGLCCKGMAAPVGHNEGDGCAFKFQKMNEGRMQMKKGNDILLFLGLVVAIVVVMALVVMNIGKTTPDTSESIQIEEAITDTQSE